MTAVAGPAPDAQPGPAAPLGEFALIDRYFRRNAGAAGVVLGIGDDAALLAPTPGTQLVLAVDMMVEGRHFLPGADPEGLGHKVLAVNLSDMAAMGATPRWALLAGALPDSDEAWLAAFARGLFALADAHGVALVGGDTTRGPRNLCVTIAGEVPVGRAIRRSGARAGDDVWVSGTLGDAMLALAALQGRTSVDAASLAVLRARLERPQPRVALGIALRGIASAMLDVSDGLTGDLGHLLEASAVGARIDVARIPLHGGAARAIGRRGAPVRARLPARGRRRLRALLHRPARRCAIASRPPGRAPALRSPASGRSRANAGELVVRDERGDPLPALPRAFDHFA